MAKSDKGLRRFIRRCREQFRVPENLEHYEEEDLKSAEHGYIKFCLRGSEPASSGVSNVSGPEGSGSFGLRGQPQVDGREGQKDAKPVEKGRGALKEQNVPHEGE